MDSLVSRLSAVVLSTASTVASLSSVLFYYALPVYVAFWSLRALYRLHFHPLSNYPGPWLAAVSTEWFEWYWNIYQPGAMLFEIEKLHHKHGPMVRIGANELHINDPEFYQSITKPGSTFLKDPAYYQAIGFPHAILGMVDPVEHRIRKQVLAPAFSPGQVQIFEPRIRCKVQQLCKAFEESARRSEPINIAAAFKAFAMDVIAEVVLGQDYGAISRPGFRHENLEIMKESIKGAWIPRAFPFTAWATLALPPAVTKLFIDIPMIDVALAAKSGLDQYLAQRDAGQLAHGLHDFNEKEDPASDRRRVSVVIERLLDPRSAKDFTPLNPDWLNEETLLLIGAGNDTTSNAMILGLYNICKSQEVQQRLAAELHEAFPRPEDDLTLTQLKQLPYLTATIKEVLRVSTPLPGRVPRKVPPEGFQLGGEMIPPGTVTHTSAYLLNKHPSVWGASADDFDPDRWLGPLSAGLEKYMTSFYRGTRQCLGMHLAWAELYLAFGLVFRRFNLAIHDTTDADMEFMDYAFMLFRGKELQVIASMN